MDTILLIFQMIPESMRIYKITEASEELRKLIFRCQNQFVNGGDESPEDVTNFLISISDGRMPLYCEITCVYDDQLDDPPFNVDSSCTVVVCGFFL